jgi:hypothetical protein
VEAAGAAARLPREPLNSIGADEYTITGRGVIS